MTVVTEAELKAIAVAPRVTLEDVNEYIVHEQYFTAKQGAEGSALDRELKLEVDPGLGLLTFCVLTLANGYTVTGESACASPENFNPEMGRKLAKGSAVNKIWGLLGFELKTKLTRIYQSLPPQGLLLSLGSPVSYLSKPQVWHAVPSTWGQHCKLTGEDVSNYDPEANGYSTYLEEDYENLVWYPDAAFSKQVDIGVRLK